VPSIIVLFCAVALSWWLDARPARGQAASVAIEIHGNTVSETCLTSQQLSARVVHYSSPGARPRGLRLVLYITGPDAAELHILRGGSIVSRRSFAQLPAPCADRRDAVALSIALALERTAAEPVDGDAAGSTSGPAAVSVSAAVSGGEVSAAQPSGGQAVSPDEAASRDPIASTRAAPSAAPDERDNEPIVLGTMPTTTSRDPRQKGSSASSLQLQLGGRLTLEAVPTPVWVGALGVELPISERLSLGITALMSSVGEAALAGARARASFLGLEVVGCRNIALGVFMLQACGGAAVALCEVSGRGYPREQPEATLLWAAVIGRATLRWPREGLIALRFVLQPHFSLSRPDLRVDGSSEHLQSFWIGGTTGLELWLALP
jgi:hypothetical protein